MTHQKLLIHLAIEAPCSKLHGIFDCKELAILYGSLANPAASYGECARWFSSLWTLLITPDQFNEVNCVPQAIRFSFCYYTRFVQ
jgi:hypothetical protein